MTCARVRARFSLYLDGDLAPNAARTVGAHVESCAACAAHLASLRGVLDLVAELPAVSPTEGVAARVFDRLEVESRGPGLAMVFRPLRARRPMIFSSLVTAGLFLLAVLGGALALDRARWSLADEPLPPVAGSWEGRLAASGTEANPLFPSADVDMPRARARPDGVVSEAALTDMAEGTLFLETVVARDGSVSTVRVLAGDLTLARPVVDALRAQKFEPVRFRGRPVAVSVYRLISRMDVLSPLT